MNIKNVHLFLEELGFDDREHLRQKNPNNHACYDCEVEHTLTDKGFPFCLSCGIINFDKPQVVEEVADPKVKQRVVSLYKRRLTLGKN